MFDPVRQSLLLERIRIEDRFNSIKYRDVSLGSTFGYLFKLTPYFKIPLNSFGKRFKIVASLLSKFCLKHRDHLREIVFVHYSKRPKDLRILDGVEKKLDNVSRFYDAEFVQTFTLTDFFRWSSFWLKNYSSIKRTVRAILAEYKLDPRFAAPLMLHFVTKSLYAEACLARLKKSNARLFLFTYDKSIYSSILAESANALGIHTASIIHGSSYHLPMGYVPVVARELLIWGPQHIDIFKTFGVEKSRMHVVGFPNLRKLGHPGYESLKQQFHIPADRKIILLASQAIGDEIALVKAFMEEIKVCEDWFPVIKIHPASPNAQVIQDLLRESKAVLLPQELQAHEALSIADVVVGLSSTLLIEALSLAKPVVIFNPLHRDEEGIGRYLTRHGSAPHFVNKGELGKFLREAILNPVLLQPDAQQKYFNELCSFREREADEQIVAYIQNVLTHATKKMNRREAVRGNANSLDLNLTKTTIHFSN